MTFDFVLNKIVDLVVCFGSCKMKVLLFSE